MKSDLVKQMRENKALIFEIENVKRNRNYKVAKSYYVPESTIKKEPA